ncbi:porin family protein [Pontibacter cellulosilyticus]|uniref:PorT family protein n=1 Tax=Pontibacter cellulosilyticus TaxID=1720253 RepID=A0A923N8E5_9BACT|nr:porin family protein [Pontibacter cellulosilyticus]MBC5994693.1 PorT family protein [Pontibacter cellulosilyticus]
MKKTLLLLLLILSAIQLAQAQYARFGAKAGGGYTRMYGDDSSSDVINSLPGFHVGLIGSYEFVSSLALQAELLYEQKGLTYDGYPISTSEALIDDQRLHYITLPVLAKLQKGGFFVEAGPYVGYLIEETTKVNIIDQASVNDPNPVILGEYGFEMSDFERWDYGYRIGLGIQLESGFFMSVHNTGGLRSFSKQLDQKNLGFMLSVGYMLAPRLP